jgi:hypothetical protein
MSSSNSDCQTCYGSGEIVTDQGPSACPDCYGDGKAAGNGNKMEWRLRELERSYQSGRNDALADIMWLVHELRRTREALVRILTRCQDAPDGDVVASYTREQAMDALGLYQRTPDKTFAGSEDA